MATRRLEPLQTCENIVRLMTEGGDERIVLDPASGLNRYLCAPRPSAVLAYASSTANDLSPGALDHLAGLSATGSPSTYATRLEALRYRLREAYHLAEDIEVVFAPSGTDLEYVAIACLPGAGARPIMNILLGADEVGSGCIHSANGQHFARTTALGHATTPAAPVAGMAAADFAMVDVPIRDAEGRARSSAEVTAAIDGAVREGSKAGKPVLIHVVHGSKTGLVLPDLADIDRLRAEHGDGVRFVVDACQARIEAADIAAYLDREAIVFLTGSKFMGGPPFSGFALVPRRLMERAAALPEGFGSIFLRAEWPSAWPGAEWLSTGTNPGLLLRLEAAVFELERFRQLGPAAAERVIDAFRGAVSVSIAKLGISEITPCQGSAAPSLKRHLETRTLATLDLSRLAPGMDFADAQRWHRALADNGVRLGQPVRCAKIADGRWAPTLRVGISMPMIVERTELSDEALGARFAEDMAVIGRGLAACIE